MRKYNALAFILLATLLASSCKDKNQAENNFSINEEVLKAQYTPKESLDLEIKTAKNKKIDSVVYSNCCTQVHRCKRNYATIALCI